MGIPRVRRKNTRPVPTRPIMTGFKNYLPNNSFLTESVKSIKSSRQSKKAATGSINLKGDCGILNISETVRFSNPTMKPCQTKRDVMNKLRRIVNVFSIA
jgi:hypothetical protein